MNRKRKEYIRSCEISEVCRVSLGGIEQKILIESYRKGAPVLLFLHGGPGFPIPFCVGARGLFPEITKKFTAVYWDQLGCGANRYPLNDRFRTDDFVRMTEQLVRYLKGRFPAEKLYLFGISWGSVLSLKTATALPDLIDGVFAAGQILLPPLRSEAFFDAVERSSAPEKVKARMREIANCAAPDPKQITLISRTARKYTNAYGGNGSPNGINPVKEIFASKDYRFSDALACFVNGYRKCESLMKELSVIDLRREFANVRVPYTVFGGTEDLVTPVKDVQALFSELGSAFLTCVVAENEGHIPSQRVMEEMFAALAETAGV